MINAAVDVERWELIEPFEIARGVMTALPVIVVVLRDAQGRMGRAEAAGVDYDGETPAMLATQVESVLAAMNDAAPQGVVSAHTLATVQTLLAPGGARNALD